MISKLQNRAETPPPQGREDLRYWHRELAGALHEEQECIASLARLRTAVEEGSAAEAASVAQILASRGKDFGQDAAETNHKIARGKLAAAAISRAEEELATAQSEVARLRAEVAEAARRELVSGAGALVADYDRTLSEADAAYDKLCGIRGPVR